MPTFRFPIEPGSNTFIAIKSGRFGFKKTTITYEDRPLFVSVTSKDLSKGVMLALPDGSNVSVRSVRESRTEPNGLEVLRNGVPLPGSIGTPGHALLRAKEARKLFYAIAALNVLYGLVVQFSHSDALFARNADATGWPYLVAALLVALLGCCVYRKQSLIALAIAIVYLIGDAALTFAMPVGAGARPGVGDIMMRVVLIVALIGAFRIIVRHKSELRAMRA